MHHVNHYGLEVMQIAYLSHNIIKTSSSFRSCSPRTDLHSLSQCCAEKMSLNIPGLTNFLCHGKFLPVQPVCGQLCPGRKCVQTHYSLHVSSKRVVKVFSSAFLVKKQVIESHDSRLQQNRRLRVNRRQKDCILYYENQPMTTTWKMHES